MTQRHDTSIHELDEKNLYAPSLRDDELLPLITRKPKSNTTDRASLGLAQARANGGSLALHDELGEQLADMSHQLKLNALHFSKTLESEKGLLEASQDVLSNNLTKTQTSKTKLSAVSSKTWGTTWLTFVSIVVVLIAWVWTYLLIRLT